MIPQAGTARQAMNLGATPQTGWPAALALLSAGVTAAEVTLMQLLSYMQWHHFAYLVVSVALLGFGASGTALALWREGLQARADALVPWLMLGCGAGLATAIALLQAPFLRFDLYLLFVERAQWLRLAAGCLLLAVPFFCAGLASGLMLTVAVERAGVLYFANLAGAGAGAMVGLALLGLFEPTRAPVMTAVLPLSGGLILHSRKREWSGWVSAGVSLLAILPLAVFASRVVMSPFKDLARVLDLPGARVVHAEPSAQGWLQIVDAPSLRGGPAADLSFRGTVPRQRAVFLDGNRYGSILVAAPNEADLQIFRASPESLPWLIGRPKHVLLLQEGAGGEAAYARQGGQATVTVVEPHRALASVLAEYFAGDSGIEVRAEEPRAVLERTPRTFDLIHFPGAGTFGGSAGLRAVSEEFLFTREAIAAAWRSLTTDGILLVTAWMDHPERTPLRMLATLVAGLKDAGVATVREHLAAVRGWASVTFLVRRSGFDAAGVEAIRSFCRDHGFDPLLLPGLEPDEREYCHAWDNPGFFALVDAVVDQRQPISSTGLNGFRLEAPTDDRPYFSQFLRPAAVPALFSTQGWQGMPFFELGSIIVALTLLLLVIFATTLIMLPLLRLGWRGAARGWTLGYFTALGVGFMLFEIVLMLRLPPFVGGPVPAAAIVLTVLLLSAGLGSRFSQHFPARPATIQRVALLAAGSIAVLGFATGVLPFGWEAGLAWRAAACALLIAPVGFVMGTAFPTGLRTLAAISPGQLPWAWAVNNCVSVVTPSVATLLAVGFGHSLVFWLAACSYLAAALITRASALRI